VTPPFTIVDYGAGNLRNVQKAVEHLGGQAGICSQPDDVLRADALILPGVGHFQDGMASLKATGLDEALRTAVRDRGVPILGICLGMHLLADEGHEGGLTEGLGLLPMSIRLMESDLADFRLPHIGWNEVEASADSVLFQDLPSRPDFYFVHSYHSVCTDPAIAAATCPFAGGVVAAVEKDSVFAVQFHPEKSQRFGLKLLDNFMRHCGSCA
jgi:glutamine amidotransferase